MTVEKVKNGIYTWGYFPALFLLREYQEDNEFEICSTIKKALDEIGLGREWYLSSKVDDDSMNETYKNILDGLNKPELINKNMPEYINEFRLYLTPINDHLNA